MNNFGNLIYNDLLLFLSLQYQNQFYFNERDMQLHLANYLKTTGHYDSVDLEYYIPRSVLVTGLLNPQVDCPWGSDLYLDLVVSKDGEYAPIELKYKTKEIITSYSRFGNVLSNVNVVKNQSAQDLGRYDF